MFNDPKNKLFPASNHYVVNENITVKNRFKSI